MAIPFNCPFCGHFTSVEDRYAGQSGPCAKCGQTVAVPSGPAAPLKPAPLTAVPGGGPGTGAAVAAAGLGAGAIVLIVLAVSGFVILACGGVAVALLLPAVQAAREAARRSSCSNNLKQIGLAFHNYNDVYGTFPPAYIPDENGQPKHSWRVLILPFVEQYALYEQYNFDEPWDSPGNLAVAQQMPPVYACPSGHSPQTGMTSYLAVVGDDTVFPGGEATRFPDITDGTSNTILIVEAEDAAVPWTEPRDLDFTQMSFQINGGPNEMGSRHAAGAQVLFADASVKFLSREISPQVLELLLNRHDGQVVPFDY